MAAATAALVAILAASASAASPRRAAAFAPTPPFRPPLPPRRLFRSNSAGAAPLAPFGPRPRRRSPTSTPSSSPTSSSSSLVVLRGQPEDVRISSPSVVPPVPSDASVDVYYAEQAIQALGTIGEVVEAYHAGLVFRVRRGDGEEADQETETETKEPVEPMECPEEFTIEWYAVNFPFGAFLPDVVEPAPAAAAGDSSSAGAGGGGASAEIGVRWRNEAHPFYSPVYNPDRWSKGRTLVGTVDAAGFSSFVDFVAAYDRRKPGYQAFEIWDRPELVPDVTRRWGPGSDTCSTFIEEGLSELYRLGGRGNPKMIANKEILKRSYAPLVAEREPTVVDASDPTQARQVRDFYLELNRAARGAEGEGLSTSAFVRLLADRLETFYVYDPPADVYYRVELRAPYFALANLYQPMSLPWQRLDLGYAVVDPGGFAKPDKEEEEEDKERSFAEELTSAAGSVGDLARRRLPPVLRRRFGPKLAIPLGVAAVLAAVAAVTNESFVAGAAVGVVVGAVGSRALS